MRDLQQKIADLEAEIERLSHSAERCRKIDLVAKATTAAGVLLLLSLVTAVLGFEPLLFVLAIAASLGGVALLGSNRRTLDEIITAIRGHEAHRAAMIDELGLQIVS